MLVGRTLLFTLAYPGSVCVLLPYGLLRLLDRGAAPTWDAAGWAGAALIAIGTAVYVWCAWDFGARGRGTPAPYDPPRELVIAGLYRFSRNPMYVGIVGVLLGESVVFRSVALAVYAAIVAIGFHLRVVLYEEPTLRRLFGERFERYKAATPRWLGRARRR